MAVPESEGSIPLLDKMDGTITANYFIYLAHNHDDSRPNSDV